MQPQRIRESKQEKNWKVFVKCKSYSFQLFFHTTLVTITPIFLNRTVEAFCLANLTTLVSAALEKELKHVFESEWFLKKFAVRSSAIGEDSTELSSAGQNDTFLGCSGKENIENAICKCWASLFAFQSVEYRR